MQRHEINGNSRFRRLGSLIAVISIAALSIGVDAQDVPLVDVVPLDKIALNGQAAQRAIYRDNDSERGDLVILARPDVLLEEADRLQSLYVIRAPFWTTVPDWILHFGAVIHFEPQRFLVMDLRADLVANLSGLLHSEGLACGGLERLGANPIKLEAPPVPSPLLPIASVYPAITAIVGGVEANRIQTTVETLAAITTRYHSSPTGRDIAQQLASEYEALRDERTDVQISLFDHGTLTPQKSLIVRIEGAKYPDETVILGSHIDSISFDFFGSSGRSPGADDNASGTATNLEVFRQLMRAGIRPDRTIEIHGYAAEEIGLVGSKDIAQKYAAAGRKVVAMVQHDMNLYRAAGAQDKIWFVSNNTSVALNDQLAILAASYAGVPTGTKPLASGSSDHASWTRNGYAAAFPFEDPSAHNRHIHTVNDTTANASSFTQAAAFAKLGLGYLLHFAGGV